uniref:Uncharacterized protein n=1 Tax=viral metagenome TaxID=1070528 RepID=A0A6C0AGG5_9ZZZZ|tara:strand:- start:9653 stop:10033 length:381 start_codon:yes stop_codon:yes gene_type:complete
MKGESNIKIDNINNPSIYMINSELDVGKNKLEKSLVELRKRVSNIEKSVMSIPSASSALSDAKKAKKSILSRSKKNNKILKKYKRKTNKVCKIVKPKNSRKKKESKDKKQLKINSNVGGYNKYWIE